MFKILLLLSIIQHASSSNITQQAIASRNQIGMTNAKVKLVDCKSLKVTFNIKNDIEQLTGLFSVHHSACPVSSKTRCGYKKVGPFDKDQDQGRKITVQLDSKYISPCKNYSDIKIRAYENDGRIRSRSTDWEAKSLGQCCDQLTSATTTTTVENTNLISTVSSNTAPPSDMHKSTPSTTVIIVSVVLIILIGAVIVVILFKRRKERKEKQNREKVIKTEENALYGIYDVGPSCNVVIDENDYYGS